MSTILRTADMAKGAFDGGKIQEYKPVGFPHEPGGLRPVSTLFYWAYAWSDEGGFIAEHPHQAFEIISFVLSGEIEHYDNQLNDWLKLQAGDVQIIRSGSGITHAERMGPGSSMFQIWFDPHVFEAVKRPASYSDYKSEVFETEKHEDGTEYIHYKNGAGPVEMKSAAEIEKIKMLPGKHSLSLNSGKESPVPEVQLFYVLDGAVRTGDGTASVNELVISDKTVECEVPAETTVFRIRLPVNPPYPLYTDSRK